MAIPVVFVFDFTSVMTRPGTYFLPENFALAGSEPLDGDGNFDALDFDIVYHDGSTTDENREEIHRARMAEVVIHDELPLDSLQYVVCRTIHEERTLRHLIVDLINTPRIVVERHGGVFFRKGMFVDEIHAKTDIIRMRFRGPVKFSQHDYAVSVYSSRHAWSGRLAPGAWRFNSLLADDPDEVWTIEIEGCVAYRAPVPRQDDIV